MSRAIMREQVIARLNLLGFVTSRDSSPFVSREYFTTCSYRPLPKIVQGFINERDYNGLTLEIYPGFPEDSGPGYEPFRDSQMMCYYVDGVGVIGDPIEVANQAFKFPGSVVGKIARDNCLLSSGTQIYNIIDFRNDRLLPRIDSEVYKVNMVRGNIEKISKGILKDMESAEIRLAQERYSKI